MKYILLNEYILIVFEHNAIWQCIYWTVAQLPCIVLQTAKLIVITVIYRMDNLHGTYSVVVTEENKDSGYKFSFFWPVPFQ